jgi:hypothetical protein
VIDVAPPLLSDGGHLTTLAPSGSGEAGSGPGADAGQDATASAGDAAMSPPSADSGVQSLPALADALMDPTVANAFEAIGASPDAPGVPYSCGTEGVTNGVLTLTKGALCSAQTGVVANYVTLDPNRFLLTGDFDVQVQFDLTMFPLPTTNRWAGFRISSTDPTCWSTENCPGLSIERYDNGALMPVENYKIWDVTSALSSATVTVVGIAPDAGPGGMTGAFRITRQGVNMLAYYQVSGAWVPGHAYAANAGPMAIQFYTGSCSNAGMCASSDEVAESVSFSHLSIALGLQDAGAIADGGSD